ncbi:Arc family DNA binding domain-containing protein [Parapedobacter lycopersici]|uniref:Arc family DNA binding domain-containing protein n=1 Tax=Parapedobacter lycopersici TaxID=1864939 RepID=UPI00214D6F0B|nr:Arc family DNA binding domain-containing protein [Parapedobacter lycopersici]
MADKADKKAFALRIHADMLKALEEWAAEEFRSTNGQIEFLLAQALAHRKRAKKNKEV